MGAYEDLRKPCERIIRTIYNNQKVPADLRHRLNEPLALFNIGGEVSIVEVFGLIVYKTKEYIRAKNDAYFKSEKFKTNLMKVLKAYSLDKEVSPDVLSGAFEFIGVTPTETLFSKKQQKQIDDDIEEIIKAYPRYKKIQNAD